MGAGVWARRESQAASTPSTVKGYMSFSCSNAECTGTERQGRAVGSEEKGLTSLVTGHLSGSVSQASDF